MFTLPNYYFIDSFIGGLHPPIKSFTRAFNPQTLPDAVHYARLQEATIIALKILEKGQPNQHTRNPNYPAKGLLPTPMSVSMGPKPALPSLPHKPKTLYLLRELKS